MGQEATRLDDDRDRRNAMTASNAPASDDPDEIEEEIEHTRAEMSETIDEIQERLDPDRLKAQAKDMAHDATIGKLEHARDQAIDKVQGLTNQATDKVRSATGGGGGQGGASQYVDTARDTGSTVVEKIRANPIPAAIAGAGVGWFLTQRSDRHEVRSGYMRNTPSNQQAYRGQQMDYDTGYDEWDRRQPEPGHMREYQEDSMMGRMTGTGGDMLDMVQRNPIPAALAGVTVGWFLMRRSKSGGDQHSQPYYYRPGRHSTYSGGYGYQGGQRNWQPYDTQGNQQQGSESQRDRMGQTAGEAQGRAQDYMHRAQDMGSQVTDQASHYSSMAKDQMTHLPHQAQDQFRNLRGTYEQKMQDNPLLMGAVAMGLGLAVGMMLPETKKEDQIFGEKRDELMHRAEDMAEEAAHRAQEVAKEAAQAAQETAMESGKHEAQDMAQHQRQSQSQSQSSASSS